MNTKQGCIDAMSMRNRKLKKKALRLIAFLKNQKSWLVADDFSPGPDEGRVDDDEVPTFPQDKW